MHSPQGLMRSLEDPVNKRKKKKIPVLTIVLIVMLLIGGVGSVNQVFQTETPTETLTPTAQATSIDVPEQLGPALPVGTPEVYCIVEGYVELHNHQIADIAGPDGTTIVATIQRQEDELWLWTIVDETMTTMKVEFIDDMTPRGGELVIGIPINETTLMELSFVIVVCGQHIYVPGMEYEPIKTQQL